MPYKKSFYYGATEFTFGLAKLQRKPLTPAEYALWKALRNRQTKGFKFRRQHPVGPFIADFYCHAALLVVEVDGAVHDNPEAILRDKNRTKFMEDQGLLVIRFRNEQVIRNLDQVIEEIGRVIADRVKKQS